MKKLIAILVLCIALLCGCSRNTKTVSGWVDGYVFAENSAYPVIIVKTFNDRLYGVAIDENTFMHSWVESEAAQQQLEKLKDGTAENIELQVHYRGGFHNTKTDNGKIKTVNATIVLLSSVLEKQACTLRDGTLLDVVNSDSDKTYQLDDGTQLLRVNISTGPENVYSGVLYSFDSLTEKAKEKVMEYYDNRGLFYDETETLEQAYSQYKSNPADFHTYLLEQSVSPAAGNDKIISFFTSVTMPLDNGGIGQEIRLGEIFDIQTGEYISSFDVFNCDMEKVMDVLLEEVFTDDFGNLVWDSDNAKLAQQIKQNIKPEYIILWNDNIEIAFPAGTLEGEDHCFIMGIDYTNKIKEIMHTWAIPDTAW